MRTKSSNKGFVLVEAIVYAVGVVILLTAISAGLYYSYSWYSSVTVGPRVDSIGATLVDRISREFRGTSGINVGSQFNTSSGYVSVISVPVPVSTTTEIGLTGGRVFFRQNAGVLQYISPSDISVTSLYFTQINNIRSTSIKTDLQITYSTKSGTTTKTYTGLTTLREH